MDEFFNYLSKEQPTLKLDEKEYPASEKLIKLFSIFVFLYFNFSI
jgi:hypothetical protein